MLLTVLQTTPTLCAAEFSKPMKALYIPALLLLFHLSAFAQGKGESPFSYKVGDSFHKAEIGGFSIKDAENGVWDYSNISPSGKDFTVEYTSDSERDDATAEVTSCARYYYSQDNTSLRRTGYENNSIIAEYDRPVTVLPFPLSCGRKETGAFHASCMYCEKLAIREFGTYSVEIDGSGKLLLPGGKTLENVYRVHASEDACRIVYDDIHTKADLLEYTLRTHPFTNDSITAFITNPDNSPRHTETYKWYAEGYRYPIIEAVVFGKDNDSGNNTVACYCSPEEQERMYDPENEDLRNRTYNAGKSERNGTEPRLTTNNGNASACGISVAENKITVTNHTASEFMATLADPAGITYKSAHGTANGNAVIDCTGLRHGEYVVRVEIDGTVYSYKANI